jgi:hypothetical protein
VEKSITTLSSAAGRGRVATIVALLNDYRERNAEHQSSNGPDGPEPAFVGDAIESVERTVVDLVRRRNRPVLRIIEASSQLHNHFADWLEYYADLSRNIDNVGLCAICGKPFAPPRSDSKCCSKPCAHILRVRRWRLKQKKYERTRKFKGAGVEEKIGRAVRGRPLQGNAPLPA